MKIHVTQEHINKGRRRNVNACPIALALREALHLPKYEKDPMAIMVNADYYSFLNPSLVFYRYIYKLPHSAQRFIKNFDNKGITEVKPFNFIIELSG